MSHSYHKRWYWLKNNIQTSNLITLICIEPPINDVFILPNVSWNLINVQYIYNIIWKKSKHLLSNRFTPSKRGSPLILGAKKVLTFFKYRVGILCKSRFYQILICIFFRLCVNTGWRKSPYGDLLLWQLTTFKSSCYSQWKSCQWHHFLTVFKIIPVF